MAAADFVKGVFNLGTSYLQRDRDRKAVADQRKRDLALIKELDWEPMYASETVPTYQRTQSPVARSYLESFLAGNNPAATFSGAPNAQLTKQRQQQSQDQMFGTMQERIAQQRAMEATTPWKVQTPTRPVVGQKGESALWTAENPQYAQRNVNKNLYDAINENGGTPLGKLPVSKGDELKGGIGAIMGARMAEQLAEAYGSADAAAEAVRRYGNIEDAMKNANAPKKQSYGGERRAKSK